VLPALCFWAVGFVAAHQGVLVAEVDAGVLRLLKKLGLNIKELGEAKYIVGSLTVPVMIEHHDLESWVNTQAERYAIR
jgi:N-acyl-L-homoserine lactone synthetase